MIKLSSVRHLLAAGTIVGVLGLTGATAVNASATTITPVATSAASLSTTASADGVISSSKPITVTETSVSPASPSVTSAGVKPDTYTNGCSSSQSEWVHGYATSYAWIVDNATWCVGDKGTTSLPYNSTLWICTGNNNGNVGYYIIVNGQRVDYSLSFPEDDLIAFASTVRVTHITINGWNYTYSC